MIKVIAVSKPEDLKKVHQIRHMVFVVEQDCPPELEYEFEEESKHFLAFFNNEPAGVARWRKTEKGYKLERFAVLKDRRGKNIGAAVLKTILEDVPKDGSDIYLHAQLTAKDFYLKYGFKEIGDHFWEAGIEHIKMKYKDS